MVSETRKITLPTWINLKMSHDLGLMAKSFIIHAKIHITLPHA